MYTNELKTNCNKRMIERQRMAWLSRGPFSLSTHERLAPPSDPFLPLDHAQHSYSNYFSCILPISIASCGLQGVEGQGFGTIGIWQFRGPNAWYVSNLWLRTLYRDGPTHEGTEDTKETILHVVKWRNQLTRSECAFLRRCSALSWCSESNN